MSINAKMLGSLLTRIVSTSSSLTYLLLPPPRLVVVVEVMGGAAREPSQVQNKMIFMGHQISSCHVPVVRSFFIYFKIISSS
jgi:hypothetical protein